MNLVFQLCIFSLILLSISTSELDFLRVLDDLISYRIVFKNYEEYEKLATPNEQGQWTVKQDENWVKMKSADDEEYTCLLPVIQSNTKKRIENYVGPSPAELLEPLYKVSDCSYRMEPYWNYEVCHGRYILQYHDEKETKVRRQYYLGNFYSTQAQMEAKKFDQLNPPKRKVGDDSQAYYPVTYVHGTTCDITNHPRTTTLIYVCEEGAKNFIQSINEISSCTYEIVIMTSRLCAHPSFQKAPTKEHEIQCFTGPNIKTESAKPKSLINIENEGSNQFMKEFGTYTGAKDFLNSIFERVDSNAAELAQINALLEAIKSSKKEPSAIGSKFNKETKIVSSSSPEYIQEFWQGKNCLKSGTGYWKYEVCFGKKVSQFNDSPGKQRQTILLGNFDQQAQIEWIEKNPHKAPLIEEDKVVQANYIFNGGDKCDETGKPRTCELRIRCRKDSADKVVIYLMEPETCSYIMVVESDLLCEGLEKVDKNGLLAEMPKEDDASLLEPSVKKISINLVDNLDDILEKFKDSKNEDEDEDGRKTPGYQIKVERIQINDDVLKMVEKLSDFKWESEETETKSYNNEEDDSKDSERKKLKISEHPEL